MGSDNGLLSIRRQAIAWTNNGLLCLLLIGLLGTNFNEILIKKHFTQEKAFENVICQIGDHFVQGDELTCVCCQKVLSSSFHIRNALPHNSKKHRKTFAKKNQDFLQPLYTKLGTLGTENSTLKLHCQAGCLSKSHTGIQVEYLILYQINF